MCVSLGGRGPGLSSADRPQVEREIQVQRTLKHENVLRLYKHFEAHRVEHQASV